MVNRRISHPKLDFNQITKYIYVGTNMCCIGHFEKKLLAKRILADLSLEDSRCDMPLGVKHYLWIPTKNHYAPRIDAMINGIRFLKTMEEYKIKTYVHCRNGHTRAPTMVIAYLMSKGMTLKNALRLVKAKRSVIHPRKRQLDALKKFEKINFLEK